MSPKKALKLIEKQDVSLDTIKRTGIDYRRLIGRGFARKVTTTETKIFSPPGAPRWAAKFKFLRKRHGIEEKVEEKIFLSITKKGRKFLAETKEEPEDDSTVRLVEPDQEAIDPAS